MKRCILVLGLFAVLGFDQLRAKCGPNVPYAVVVDGMSAIYARCIPAEAKGSQGRTQVLMVRQEGDTVLASYDWFNRNGLVLGWSPTAGKVAVMRVKQDEGLPPDKQIEFSFYLGDKLLRSYTTAEVVALGAKLERDDEAAECDMMANGVSHRAVYTVEGCKQVPRTNDYYFSVRLSEKQVVCFDITTGNVCRVRADGGGLEE